MTSALNPHCYCCLWHLTQHVLQYFRFGSVQVTFFFFFILESHRALQPVELFLVDHWRNRRPCSPLWRFWGGRGRGRGYVRLSFQRYFSDTLSGNNWINQLLCISWAVVTNPAGVLAQDKLRLNTLAYSFALNTLAYSFAKAIDVTLNLLC